MMEQEVQRIKFSPFQDTDLGEHWRITFGQWEIRNGKLCHIRPDSCRRAEKLFGGVPDMGSIALVGDVRYIFPDGGVDHVHLRFNFSLAVSDSFAVGLDEWAAEWRQEYAMKAVLSDCYSGSKGHAYDDTSLSPTKPETINRLEVEAHPHEIRFLLNGRQMFQAIRTLRHPFRVIEIRTRAGVQIADVDIETRGHHRCVSVKRVKKPLLAACVDFWDDLLYAPFTAEMLDRLVERIADVGCRRIYWLNSIRIRPEALGPSADVELNRKLDSWNQMTEGFGCPSPLGYIPQTARNCYPFLPKICSAAHKRGMEVYSVNKPFDLGFFRSRDVSSPFVVDDFLNRHPEVLLSRWNANRETNNADRPVSMIKFYKDDNQPHAIKANQLSVWISDDNRRYTRVTRDVRVTFGSETKSFPIHWVGGNTEPRSVQVITLEGLDIRSRHFAVVVADTGAFTFRNRIYRLVEVFDEHGGRVCVSCNLPGHPRSNGKTWEGTGSFVFEGAGWTTMTTPTGVWCGRDWAELFGAMDGSDVGIAFRRGQRSFEPGTPNPAHPAIHRLWLDWVQESLAAGVDGIDLRIMHHNNIMDWANFGFGTLVEKLFKERYGHELRPEASCRTQHMELLGDAYTEFVRAASRMTRDAGKKFQHHIELTMDSPPEQRAMSNVRWDWRGWIEQGLLDAITLKMEPHVAFFDEVVRSADKYGVETYACPFLNLILGMSRSWQTQLSNLVGQVVAKGANGLILYQTTSFLEPTKSGEIILKYPEMARVLNPG